MAFAFLADGRHEESRLTYEQLDQRARSVAAHLQERGLAGQRVVLAYPSGLDFVVGLYGCLYAGCVAVPTSPPYRRQRRERFNGIVANSGAQVVLSTNDFSLTAQQLETDAHQSNVQWLATDLIGNELADSWVEPPPEPGALAMLQYTSGSTSAPKGVMLSHSNLIHNTRVIGEAFNVGGAEASVFWLPTYHDMGLIGGVMAPVVTSVPTVMMSPNSFLQDPLAWLSAISRYRATISGGPNFAYDLAVRKISDEDRAGLDLSSWTLAFIGAEPIQPETLKRFAKAFEPCGFKPSAFYPCYGLAEATLMVSGPRRGEGPIEERRSGVARVACGRAVSDTLIKIVDPVSGEQCGDGEVGEVWVMGPSVGQGYWKEREKSERVFGCEIQPGSIGSERNDRGIGNGDAVLRTSSSGYLRTGDLGYVSDGRLFITGRRDDMMIVRGVNRFPQDIESAARRSHALLAGHSGAAFAATIDGQERYILVHEVTRNGAAAFEDVLAAASRAVLEECDVALDAVVLVRSGSIPRTSSGKVQRFACRDAFLKRELRVVAQGGLKVRQRSAEPRKAGSHVNAARVSAATHGEAFAVICEHAQALSPVPLPELTPQTPVSALGLDSIQRVELAASLEKAFGRRLPNTCDVQTLGELAAQVEEHLMGSDAGDGRLTNIQQQDISREQFDVSHFPEFIELERHEQAVREAVGENPYFRIDEGGTSQLGVSRIDGREVVNFCGYDYVGMSHDPEVVAAMKAAIDRYGASAGASRLVSGEKRVHRELEQALARFFGTADAIAFVSGHATNVTTIGHLLSGGDLIVHDALAHNSILQGARLCGASQRAFGHNDWAALDALLGDIRNRYRRVLIAIEGVYSMDGDWPDLPRFIEIKKKHKAMLLVDEAHSLGTMGPTGRGIGEHYDVNRSDVDLWMGTLSKSLASCGGFIAGSSELVKYLKYTAPGFVYSVGLSPPNAAAALASLGVLEREPQRVLQLRDLAALFLDLARKRGLDTGLAAGSPVVPVIVGNSVDSLRLSKALYDRGINVQPILRPAVPENAARLRFFITVNHTRAQVRSVVDAVAEEMKAIRR